MNPLYFHCPTVPFFVLQLAPSHKIPTKLINLCGRNVTKQEKTTLISYAVTEWIYNHFYDVNSHRKV